MTKVALRSGNPADACQTVPRPLGTLEVGPKVIEKKLVCFLRTDSQENMKGRVSVVVVSNPTLLPPHPTYT